MTMAIKRYTRLEMSFNAVERVVEFMEIEQESPAITDKRPPPEVSNEKAFIGYYFHGFYTYRYTFIF